MFSWSKILLEKLIVALIFKKLPSIYDAPGFTTVFTIARHRPFS
jgi:hypothetical protein